MNSRQLEYFRLVCEAGSLSNAALTLGITQPGLSRHVRDLEEELGVSLLHRTGRGVEPTSEGTRLLEHAAAIAERLECARNDVIASRDAPVGNISIGLTPTIGRVLTVPLTRAFNKAFPTVTLRFVEGFSVHLLEGLTAGKIDIALLYESNAANRLHAHAVATEELELIGSAKEPTLPPSISFAELVKLPLVLPGTPFGLKHILNAAAMRAAVSIPPHIEADGFGPISALVAEGLGYTVLPRQAVADDLAVGRLQSTRIDDPPLRREVILATGINMVRMRWQPRIVDIVVREAKVAYANDSALA